MSLINITYGQNNGIKQFETPVIQLVEIRLQTLGVIRNYLAGTDSDEWLVEAEEKTYKELKNG